MCRQERAFKMDKRNKIDFQTSSGGGVSCFRAYEVHELENHPEETKKPFKKNNDNVEIEPFDKYFEVKSFSEAQSHFKVTNDNTEEGNVDEKDLKTREN